MSERVCNRISIVAALALTAGILAGIVIPAGTGWDFANFYDAGRKMLAGQTADLYDPFVRIGGSAPQGQLPYYGAPITAWLFAAIAWLSPLAAMTVFKIADTAAILAGLLLLYRRNLPLARKTGLGVARYRAAFVVAALLFQPFWTIYRVGGQTTPFLFLGFVLACGWLAVGRLAAAAAAFVIVVAMKPAFVLVLFLIVVFAGWRFFAYTVAAGVSAAGLSLLTMGWSIHQRFLEHIVTGKLSAWPWNSSLTVTFDDLRVLFPHANAEFAAAALVVRLVAASLVIAVLLRARRQIPSEGESRHFTALMACVAGLLLLPVVWEHYLSVLFIPTAHLLALTPALRPAARWKLALFGASCVTQNLVAVLWLRSLIYPGVVAWVILGLFKSVPLLLFTALIWLHRDDLLRLSAAGAFTARPSVSEPVLS